jgi:predicted DNA-binding protein YlxM (UPF0122 family)
MKDKFDRGRANTPNGEQHYAAMLTIRDVERIREVYVPHVYSQQRLAEEYNVSRSTIEDIVHGRTWKRSLV